MSLKSQQVIEANKAFIKTFAYECDALGISEFCVAPGSRSTSLALAVASHPNLKSYIHFDERSLAFMALGIAKVTQKPVALICSSGTALANFLPAVIEASQSNIPLLLFTADRPPELLGNFANQSIQQQNIFQDYIRHYVNIPPPDSGINEAYLKTRLDFAHYCSKIPGNEGPVHVNCQFREPFSVEPLDMEPNLTSPFVKHIDSKQLDAISLAGKGLVVIGKLQGENEQTAVKNWLADQNCYIIADVLSCLKGQLGTYEIQQYESADFLDGLKLRWVVHLGSFTVSKQLNIYLAKADLPYYRIHPSVKTYNEFNRSQIEVHGYLEEALNFLSVDNDKICPVSYKQAFSFDEQLYLEFLISIDHQCPVFVGNSTMVRALNSMKIIHKGQYYANRGASGIDGNISTAIGLLSQINKPSIALLGDLSFLHDIGALALLTKLELPPVLFIVTNNGGGGIFQKLPIATNQKHFEEFFFTPHKQNLVDIAKSFGLKVKEINQLNEFKTSINSWLEESTHTMIQINL